MFKQQIGGFWNRIARLILRNRVVILLTIAVITVFLSLQWKNIQISHTEANLLPADHPVSLTYLKFLSEFGEEGNAVVMGVEDSLFFTPEHLHAWQKLNEEIKAFPEVDMVVSVSNLKTLEKDEQNALFELQSFPKDSINTEKEASDFKKALYAKLPFYKGLVYNADQNVVQSIIYLKKDIVNTSIRKDFVFDDFIPLVEKFEKTYQLDVRISGMPYVRSLNSQNTLNEIGLFIGGALFVTSFIFFMFFRSFRATFISIIIVIIGVMWAFGTLGLLQYDITALTAVIPPLIIVIGIPNCIFLINKYQSEVQKHGNQAKSLQRVISKIGNATLMTNLTTAAGFATFAFVNSESLRQFGILASLNIISIFILSLLIIPVIYSFMHLPTEKHLNHLNRKWIETFVDWMSSVVKERSFTIYITTVLVIVISVIGVTQIKRTGSLIEDMPKEADFYKDILFFEKAFGGIIPIEITIDTKRPKGVFRLSTLNRMEELEQLIVEIPELSSPISAVSLVKYAKQAYYNGNPNYYQLPTSQENNFIMSYVKNSEAEDNLMESFVDSTQQRARITTYMKDLGTERMEEIEATLREKTTKIFPEDRYDVTITGKAILFLKGTNYLINNLAISLSLAILLIAGFMAWSFRSYKMILISLIPNLLPLLITAGMMGYLNIPLKPSTILVFSVAFGISVDDTIHFLAKYRQELLSNGWKIRKSVFAALHETGVSMFYTSVVLFFGFSVFMLSSYGGTIALGGLVSVTLLFAMLSNLLLLPSLLLSLDKSLTNKASFRKPIVNLLPEEEE
jgi:predicted RND superfamily exporter protein